MYYVKNNRIFWLSFFTSTDNTLWTNWFLHTSLRVFLKDDSIHPKTETVHAIRQNFSGSLHKHALTPKGVHFQTRYKTFKNLFRHTDNFHFRRNYFSPIPLSPKWIFGRKSFKVENNWFYLNDLPLINYIITKCRGYQLTSWGCGWVLVWVGVSVDVSVGGCGCGVGGRVEFSVRWIAPTDTHVTW
jgi:hypothetical protein